MIKKTKHCPSLISQLTFGFISTFLCGLGFSIIMPGVPFLVAPYVSQANHQTIIVTMLISIYALFVFFFFSNYG